jgi:C-terminal processing protease CtpA/Prc
MKILIALFLLCNVIVADPGHLGAEFSETDDGVIVSRRISGVFKTDDKIRRINGKAVKTLADVPEITIGEAVKIEFHRDGSRKRESIKATSREASLLAATELFHDSVTGEKYRRLQAGSLEFRWRNELQLIVASP